MSRSALLIGGTGGTGGHIATGLTERGFDVTILHRGVHESPEIEHLPHIHVDPSFPDQVAEAIGDRTFDVVVAAYGRLEGLAKVFTGRCRRFIGVGAVAAYAGFMDPAAMSPQGFPLMATEDARRGDTVEPVNQKASAFVRKVVAAEDAVLAEHERGGYSATLFRYPAIYGPQAVPIPATSEWSYIKRLEDGRPFLLLPNGGMTTYTRCAGVNAAHAILLSIEHPRAGGEIFNIADDDQYDHAQWVEMIMDEMGVRAEIVGLPEFLNPVTGHLLTMGGTTSRHMTISTEKVRTLLGYTERQTAREALGETVRWVREHGRDNRRDPFDYALEDEVYAALQEWKATWAGRLEAPEIMHSYAHPKKPGTGTDERGR
ncbi:NAD-dependent epimerase/dehydratase family protein [Georgenia sp. AZ-5]|uniref:NAD-dependent epimerase/dehydratase family protein n=1 Tax=Georgenia sp. AZ-5 TaxID=3367526 RepID=UPI0037541900